MQQGGQVLSSSRVRSRISPSAAQTTRDLVATSATETFNENGQVVAVQDKPLERQCRICWADGDQSEGISVKRLYFPPEEFLFQKYLYLWTQVARC